MIDSFKLLALYPLETIGFYILGGCIVWFVNRILYELEISKKTGDEIAGFIMYWPSIFILVPLAAIGGVLWIVYQIFLRIAKGIALLIQKALPKKSSRSTSTTP